MNNLQYPMVETAYDRVVKPFDTKERIESQIQFHEKKLQELKELQSLIEKQPDLARAMELMTSGIL